MANFNGSVQSATGSNQTASVDRADVTEFGGRVRYMMSTYTVPASSGPQIGDTITWGTLPNGARLVSGSKLFFSAGAVSSTLNLGDSGSAARYLAATSVTSAGSATAEAHLASGATYKNTAATALVSTVAGAALQAAQVITLHAYYVID